MDMSLIRSIVTVVAFVTFLGIIAWAYSSKRKEAFDAAARMAVEDDELIKNRSKDDLPAISGAITLASSRWSASACALLLWKMSSQRFWLEDQTMGHARDELGGQPAAELVALMFYHHRLRPGLLVLYPPENSPYPWTSTGQYEAEQKKAADAFGPIFARYAAMDIPAVAGDPQAREIGQRLFLNYCSQCHASDARGSKGFPNLADKDW
jgi:cbb3-type cytochrome oxidase subunit 3